MNLLQPKRRTDLDTVDISSFKEPKGFLQTLLISIFHVFVKSL